MSLIAAWSPDGKRLLTAAGNDEQGAKDNTARIWDGATGKELLVFRGHTKSVWPGILVAERQAHRHLRQRRHRQDLGLCPPAMSC